MRRSPAIAAAALTALVAAAPAAAAGPPVVAQARCDPSLTPADATAARGERLGPFVFRAGWDGYANWSSMERLRNPRDGTYYAKSGIYASRGTVASLSIAPAFRAAADFVYGQRPDGEHVLSDVVRFHACARGRTFFSGGLVVKGPACVLIEARERRDPQVYRRMVSINMGDTCPVPAVP